jgi:thiosulfate/3-mercaptopyruvate sulfurtransferase
MFLTAAALLALAAVSANARAFHSYRDGCDKNPLITPEEMVTLKEAGATVLDVFMGSKQPDGCTDRTSYNTEHVAGAYPLDWRCELSTPAYLYELPDKQQFQDTMRSLGLERDSTIVVYDRAPGENRFAVRAEFVFEYFGFDNVYVVDGGLERIKLDLGSGDLTTVVPPAPTPSDVVVGQDDSLITDAQYVYDNLGNKKVNMIDARPRSMYWGRDYGIDAFDGSDSRKVGGLIHTGQQLERAGHIPGCSNRPWKENYDFWQDESSNNKHATFKPTEELLEIYAQYLRQSETTVTICNEGIHAVLDAFVLKKILCYDNVLIYEGSHGEWDYLPMSTVRDDVGQQPQYTLPLTSGCETDQDCIADESNEPVIYKTYPEES